MCKEAFFIPHFNNWHSATERVSIALISTNLSLVGSIPRLRDLQVVVSNLGILYVHFMYVCKVHRDPGCINLMRELSFLKKEEKREQHGPANVMKVAFFSDIIIFMWEKAYLHNHFRLYFSSTEGNAYVRLQSVKSHFDVILMLEKNSWFIYNKSKLLSFLLSLNWKKNITNLVLNIKNTKFFLKPAVLETLLLIILYCSRYKGQYNTIVIIYNTIVIIFKV